MARRAPWGGRCRRGAIGRTAGTAAYTERPRVIARRWGAVVTGRSGRWRAGVGRAAARGPRRERTSRTDVGRVGRAGPKVGEDLVDRRRLGDKGDAAHRAVAGGTRERVDLEEMLEEGLAAHRT